MNILLWIILGALAGWIGSMFAGTNHAQGLIGNIIVGIIGAFLGGLLSSLIGAGGVTGFNLFSLLVAVIGSVAFISVAKAVTR